MAVQALGRGRRTRSYLAQNMVGKLQLGAGMNAIDGWFNTDLMPRRFEIVPLDAGKSFPLPDSAFQFAFSEHQIELLSFDDARSMLKECYRVLKPGGTVRIATPSLDVLVALCSSEKTGDQQKYIEWVTDQFLPDVNEYRDTIVVNNAFHGWGHQFIYDFATLGDSMSQAGFVDVTQYPPGASDKPDLQDLESHGRAVGNEAMNRFETMVLEGTKPQ